MSRQHTLHVEVDALKEFIEAQAIAIEELTERVNELSKAAGLEPLKIELIEEVDEEAEALMQQQAALEEEEKATAAKKAALQKAIKEKADKEQKKK